jgi:uncharacterized protein (TIGR04255 family)
VAIELAPPDRRILKTGHLALVVCQVRFDATDALEDRQLARQFFDRLGGQTGHYPKLSQIRTQRVAFNVPVTPGETTSSEEQRGWRFSAADDTWHVTLLSDSLALETTSYQSWDEFSPRLEQALTVLGELVEPAVEERLGLRFVNILSLNDVRNAADWEEYIAPEFLGPILHPMLGAGIKNAEHRILLILDEQLQCLVRYGLAPDAGSSSGAAKYLIDLDTFREIAAPFDSSEVHKISVVMNDRNVSLFQQIVTAGLLDRLRESDTDIVEEN